MLVAAPCRTPLEHIIVADLNNSFISEYILANTDMNLRPHPKRFNSSNRLCLLTLSYAF